jgi:hypothetical protein
MPSFGYDILVLLLLLLLLLLLYFLGTARGSEDVYRIAEKVALVHDVHNARLVRVDGRDGLHGARDPLGFAIAHDEIPHVRRLDARVCLGGIDALERLIVDVVLHPADLAKDGP